MAAMALGRQCWAHGRGGCSPAAARRGLLQIKSTRSACATTLPACRAAVAPPLPVSSWLLPGMALGLTSPQVKLAKKDQRSKGGAPHIYEENAKAVQVLLRTARDAAHPTAGEARGALAKAGGDEAQFENVQRQCRKAASKAAATATKPRRVMQETSEVTKPKKAGPGSRKTAGQVAYDHREAAAFEEKKQAAFMTAVRDWHTVWLQKQKGSTVAHSRRCRDQQASRWAWSPAQRPSAHDPVRTGQGLREP